MLLINTELILKLMYDITYMIIFNKTQMNKVLLKLTLKLAHPFIGTKRELDYYILFRKYFLFLQSFSSHKNNIMIINEILEKIKTPGHVLMI